MNILFLGPQGSGKGTQARLLTEKFGLYYFEAGGFLREQAERNEVLREMLSQGQLVPDVEISSYITAFLDEKGLYENVLFDGFPRSLEQYNFIKNWLSDKKVTLDLVIVLEISEEETVKRLSARRQDPKTGKIYNLVTDLPPADVDTESLVQREDDKPESIKKRLSLYRERTEPLIAEMKKVINVVEVNGERPVEVISEEIEEIVKKSNENKN